VGTDGRDVGWRDGCPEGCPVGVHDDIGLCLKVKPLVFMTFRMLVICS
jgi:hypothetical protein